MPNYFWLITKDHITDNDTPLGTYQNAVGVMGPRTGDLNDVRKVWDTPKEFRILDDDNELYYEGIYWGPDDDLFGPLDDFGKGNAGATDIQYKNAAGEWETI